MFKAEKQPADQLDYDVDFSQWLPKGDTITTAVAIVEPSLPGELVIDSVQLTTQIVKVWLSGGIDGSTYKITVTVSTAGTRIKQEEFKIRIREL